MTHCLQLEQLSVYATSASGAPVGVHDILSEAVAPLLLHPVSTDATASALWPIGTN
jgi:hypothetical protein